MWPIEEHVRVSVDNDAKAVLRALDGRLYPTAHLCGVRADLVGPPATDNSPSGAGPPIVVLATGPELASEHLASVAERARLEAERLRRVAAASPEPRLNEGGPWVLVEDSAEPAFQAAAVRTSLQQALVERDASDDRESWCGDPVLVRWEARAYCALLPSS
jgi:hypothetical protein